MIPERPIDQFTPSELEQYADEHVLYEITHFVRAAQAIEAAHSGRFPMNFAIEVFALHLRNLLDFFAPRSARKTDVTAKCFRAEWEDPELDPCLVKARWMADKQVAHLTTDRTTDFDQKSWAVLPISRSLSTVILQFLDSTERVSTGFREKVILLLSELPTEEG